MLGKDKIGILNLFKVKLMICKLMALVESVTSLGPEDLVPILGIYATYFILFEYRLGHS